MKHKQALKAVEACSCAWVEFGVSVRDLSLHESIAARNVQAKIEARIAYAELPWLTYQPSASGIEASVRGAKLVWMANQLAAQEPRRAEQN